MSTNPDSNPVFEVKPGDVTITESGGVEIVNVNLAEALRSSLEMQARLKDWLAGLNIFCPTNFKCSLPTEKPSDGSVIIRT